MKKSIINKLKFWNKEKKQELPQPQVKDPKETAIQIANAIGEKFRNWATAEDIQRKMKHIGNVEYVFNLLQTLVYYKLAVVRQMPRERPKFKVVFTKEARVFEIKKSIEMYTTVIEALKKELADLEKPITNNKSKTKAS